MRSMVEGPVLEEVPPPRFARSPSPGNSGEEKGQHLQLASARQAAARVSQGA